jgi:hypothetical protein
MISTMISLDAYETLIGYGGHLPPRVASPEGHTIGREIAHVN